MKTSVSVPDELWVRAEHLADETPGVDRQSSSSVIQAALRAWVAERAPLMAREAPADLAALQQQVSAGLTEQAREQFRRGYQAGLLMAEIGGWSIVEETAMRHRFDIRALSNHWFQSIMYEDRLRAESSPQLSSDEVWEQLSRGEPWSTERVARTLLYTDEGSTPESIARNRKWWASTDWPASSVVVSALGCHPTFDEYAGPSTPYLRGVEQSMRDLWTQVLQSDALFAPASGAVETEPRSAKGDGRSNN